MHNTRIKITFILTSTFAERVLERHRYHHIYVKSNTNDVLWERHKGCSDVASVLLVISERYKSHKGFLFTILSPENSFLFAM